MANKMRNKTVQEIDFQGVPLIVVDSKVIGFGIELLPTIGSLVGIESPEDILLEETPAPEKPKSKAKKPKRHVARQVISEEGTFMRLVEDATVHVFLTHGKPVHVKDVESRIMAVNWNHPVVAQKLKDKEFSSFVTANLGTMFRKSVMDRPERGHYVPTRVTLDAYELELTGSVTLR